MRSRRPPLRVAAFAAMLALAAVGERALAQENAPIVFDAEEGRVSELNGQGTITLNGGVNIRKGEDRLVADTASLDQKTGLVSATGGVVVTSPGRGVQYADQIVLDRDMTSGMAKGFAARLPGDVKIAADTAILISPRVSELNRAIYTPCAICEKDGVTPKEPSWSIQAEKVVRDQDRHLIYFRNAYIKFKGVPVMLAPGFSIPDDTAPRTSGLLPPRITASDRRGLSYEQPYYLVTSPYSDLTLTPQINTNLTPFLTADYRRRFWSGGVQTRVGYTYETDVEPNGLKFGPRTSRSYILADGQFAPIQNWRLGFTAERASDDFIFDKYGQTDVLSPRHGQDEVFGKRALYESDDHRLLSQAYAVRQTQLSYISAAAVSVQGLRPTDYDRTFPLIGPLVEAKFEPISRLGGGRLRVAGSLVALQRQQAPGPTSAPPPPTAGIDSRRASVNVDWRRTDTLTGGLRLASFLQARGDAYSLNDLPAPGGSSASIAQGQAALGAEMSYPLIRQDANGSIILEPMVQALIASKADIDPRIPNEDSQVLEFDETNLMRPNRFTGQDRYIGGAQVNLGLRMTVQKNSGKSFSLLLGRAFSEDSQAALYPVRSGLTQGASDWIVAGEAAPRRNMSLFTRARFDGEDGSLHRFELGVDLHNSHTDGYVRYLRDSMDVTGVERQDLDLNMETLVKDNWGLSLYAVRDLEGAGWRRRDLGIFYQDDCLRFDIIYRHRDEFTNTAAGLPSVRPSSSLFFRLSLATLGDKR